MNRIRETALCSLLFNVVFSAYHIILGSITHSWWLFTVGVYYAALSLVRFVVVVTKKQDRFIAGFTGMMLLALSLPLVGTTVLSLVEDRGSKLNEIVMIAMAAYAFTKITLAIVNLIRSRKSNNIRQKSLLSISFADACVSIFALQRSMLVSFGDMSDENIFWFNLLLGAGVCIIVFLLGLNIARKRNE